MNIFKADVSAHTHTHTHTHQNEKSTLNRLDVNRHSEVLKKTRVKLGRTHKNVEYDYVIFLLLSQIILHITCKNWVHSCLRHCTASG